MSTTIQVTKELAARLKNLKTDTGAKSIDAIITALLNERQDQNDADVAENSDQEEDPVPHKRCKLYVQDAL